MRVILLHHSIIGDTRDLAARFKYPFKNFINYRGENEKLVLIGRHLYKSDDIYKLEQFIKYHKANIIGVIISDDKNFGHRFGDAAEFYNEMKIEVLGLWDVVVTDEQIRQMEALIDERI